MTDKTSKFAGILRNRSQDSQETDKPAKRGPGRPGGKGKRLNPDYAQVTAYIPKTLHGQTKIKLIQQDNREFSDLIEELLKEWNRKNDNSNS